MIFCSADEKLLPEKVKQATHVTSHNTTVTKMNNMKPSAWARLDVQHVKTEPNTGSDAACTP